jgi:hypothetical protein
VKGIFSFHTDFSFYQNPLRTFPVNLDPSEKWTFPLGGVDGAPLNTLLLVLPGNLPGGTAKRRASLS